MRGFCCVMKETSPLCCSSLLLRFQSPEQDPRRRAPSPRHDGPSVSSSRAHAFAYSHVPRSRYNTQSHRVYITLLQPTGGKRRGKTHNSGFPLWMVTIYSTKDEAAGAPSLSSILARWKEHITHTSNTSCHISVK